MKTSFTRCLLAVGTLSLTLAFATLAQAQAEKVKERAKDLKKKVEGTAPKTNAPPAKPTPPRR